MNFRVKPTVPFIPKPDLEAAAESLLEQYQKQEGEVAIPPIPIEFIAYFLGFDFDWEIFQDHDTLAFIDPNEMKICFNLGRSDYFDQIGNEYTLAHELGHYQLKHFKSVNAQSQSELLREPSKFLHREDHGEKYHSHEFQAEYFASCLLMPRRLILDQVKIYNVLRWGGIAMLAKKFTVSKTAMVKRLEQLDLIYVAGKKLYRNKQEADRQNRVS